MNAFTRLLVLLSVALLSAGCLVGAHSNTRQEGNYVSPSTLSQIQEGKTHAAWVAAVLGAPTEKIKVDGHTEIWRYAFTEIKSSSGYLFLVFDTSDRKVKRESVFVELNDGVVSRHWRG